MKLRPDGEQRQEPPSGVTRVAQMLCPFESEDAMREGALHFVSLITGSWLYLGLAQELELGCICDPLPVAQRGSNCKEDGDNDYDCDSVGDIVVCRVT